MNKEIRVNRAKLQMVICVSRDYKYGIQTYARKGKIGQPFNPREVLLESAAHRPGRSGGEQPHGEDSRHEHGGRNKKPHTSCILYSSLDIHAIL
jgi:hypothetical protein